MKKVLERCRDEIAALKLNRQISGAVSSKYLEDTLSSERRSPVKSPDRPGGRDASATIPEEGDGEDAIRRNLMRPIFAKLPPKTCARPCCSAEPRQRA